MPGTIEEWENRFLRAARTRPGACPLFLSGASPRLCEALGAAERPPFISAYTEYKEEK